MSDPNFTAEEIRLAMDRFQIDELEHETHLYLADDWDAPEPELSTIDTCSSYIRNRLVRGHSVRVIWKVPNGTTAG